MFRILRRGRKWYAWYRNLGSGRVTESPEFNTKREASAWLDSYLDARGGF